MALDNAEVRAWLSRGKKLQQEIDTLKRAQEEAMARTVNITSAIKHVPRMLGRTARHDEALIEYADSNYVESLSRRIAELEAALFEISEVIYAVRDGTLRLVLINRYVLFKRFEVIAVDMNYTYRNIMYLHAKAINAIVKMVK